MTSTDKPGTIIQGPATDWLRPTRYIVRIPLLTLHLLVGLPLALLFINPLGARCSIAGEAADHRAIRSWAIGICWIFGLRVQRFGQALDDPAMLVANHLSWIDIPLIHSQRAAVFVGKAEIARWPLLGWMAKAAGTIFLKRGSTDSLNWVAERLSEKLSADRSVAIFPEAGTGNGLDVRRFHARLLKAAVLTDAPIQPVALRFMRDGQFCLSVTFRDKENLLQNIWRVLGERRIDAQLHFLEPIREHEGLGRRQIAAAAQQAVTAAYHEGMTLG